MRSPTPSSPAETRTVASSGSPIGRRPSDRSASSQRIATPNSGAGISTSSECEFVCPARFPEPDVRTVCVTVNLPGRS